MGRCGRVLCAWVGVVSWLLMRGRVCPTTCATDTELACTLPTLLATAQGFDGLIRIALGMLLAHRATLFEAHNPRALSHAVHHLNAAWAEGALACNVDKRDLSAAVTRLMEKVRGCAGPHACGSCPMLRASAWHRSRDAAACGVCRYGC